MAADDRAEEGPAVSSPAASPAAVAELSGKRAAPEPRALWNGGSGRIGRIGRALQKALTPQPPAESALSGWLFLRLLGLVYLVAFLSLWPQLLGLIGSHGMLPAAPFLKAVAARLGAERFSLLPTLFWLGCSDGALRLVCALGVAASLLVLADRLVWPALLTAWIAYLSLVGVGRDFMGFQWDGLLLEAGGLALLMQPLRPLVRPALGWAVPAGRWLLLWLVVRFMFSAGWAKLRSGDPTWRDLTALHFHFETQPLPTWLGYYAHQLPSAVKKLSVVMMFVIELAVPLLVLVPRFRRHAFWPLTGLMVLVAATGNYGFFNLLSIALWVPVLPDSTIERWLPTPWLRRLDALRQPELPSRGAVPRLLGLGLRSIAVAILLTASVGQALLLLLPGVKLRWPFRAAIDRAQPLHLVNRYGLFAVMTTERPEIILEGSDDGKTWLPYEFKYKPGELARAPRWNAPHQPRLDWQMWFAAMQPADESPWLQGLCIRLLQGSRDVLRLLERDPFGHPPRYLRATLFQYHFTTLSEKRQTGAYWKRTDPQPYINPVSLK